ncbi:MAG: DNA methyltransferase [Bacteroidetes bacterium]|nr:DNA methyltransferase [Bacteroidota bacterium]
MANSIVLDYCTKIADRYKLGNATEHTYRGDLQQLIESIVPEISATNEPKRQSCGAPDYILTKKNIPVGFIEAKDIGDMDLDGIKKTGNKEQFDRYKASLNNLIFTDYLNFHLYRDGQFVTKMAIAEVTPSGIKPLQENFAAFENLIKDFSSHIGQTIKSSKKLAEMMAGKARLLSDVIEKALNSDESKHDDSTLKDQMSAFKQILIHDITPKGFADVYAQTIAYGMFAARLHDPTLPTFSRQEAAELIPKSNPFLRKLFGYIAGPDIDDRIKWIVDSLVEVFLACNVEEILKNYGKTTKMEDPIIHFYETFLSEYDPKLRKSRGVWYTPAPVVNFIVRAVDDLLKSEFDLKEGLADTSKVKIKLKGYTKATADQRSKVKETEIEQEVHKIQILDPATGTGTFLAEVIKHVYGKFEGQQGIWSNYVETHLLPRLNGFELLMASYAMAHLQLDLLLTETGFNAINDQRFRVYLTNSLEESHPDTGTLFANWLSAEANEANHIKRNTPVMCIIGNPPYSGESANKGEWIMSLMEDYKKEPGGNEKLKEKNYKFINADEYKFIRFGQHFIEKNGSGILAYINPHGFLDNPTFRGMRWNLLKTYDKIYTIDLHGNAKKKEVSPDGSPDENVFDIEQGVSINFFIKTGKKKNLDLAEVFHLDLFGKRQKKYNFLLDNSLKSARFTKINYSHPDYFFKPKNFGEQKAYNKAFSIQDLFPINSLGLLTKRDELSVDFDTDSLERKIIYFLDETKSTEEVCKKFGLVIKDKDKWDANQTRKMVSKNNIKHQIKDFQYRPFDNRKVFYNSYFVARPNTKVLGNFINDNDGLIIGRQGQAVGGNDWNVIFTCKHLTDQNIYRRGGGTVFPLYIYTENFEQETSKRSITRIPNLSTEITKQIADHIKLEYTFEKELSDAKFAPIDILNYIYAVLHSPTYRVKYKEFLKTSFPKIPFPKNKNSFWQLVKLGEELRKIHLLESVKTSKFITKYPVDGNNIVVKYWYESGKVYINDKQYFDNVPELAWNFIIGGYEPAQKWLKDRKDRKLEFDDILHYQKIIVALTETDRIMKEIDKIEIE